EVVDVDFFLTFGAYWIKPVFGIPIERMYDLGWAFSEYVKDIMPVRNEKDDRILLVSSPSITDNILDLAERITVLEANVHVDIRLHPQEELTEEQQNRISELSRVQMARTNNVDSIFAVLAYSRI